LLCYYVVLLCCICVCRFRVVTCGSSHYLRRYEPAQLIIAPRYRTPGDSAHCALANMKTPGAVLTCIYTLSKRDRTTI
jgi:hypothetical protein